MMIQRFFYLIALFSLASSSAISQDKTEKVSTQTNKQKVAVVVPSAAIDDKVSLVEGKVTVVYDGDTLSIETKDGKVYSIWLKGIDAPENKQNYGKKARKTLADLIEGREVTVLIHKKGQYDRYIGNVYLNGEDVGLKQVEAGMAWHFKQFGYEQTSEERKKYAQAQAAAQTARRGLWEDKSPVAPWDYRKEMSQPEPEKKDSTAENATTDDGKTQTENASSSSDRKYILGPRGGCYYVSASGSKVYVKDKSLCGKPQ